MEQYIVSIAKDIADLHAIFDWRFYLIQLVLLGIAVVGGNWLSGYVKMKGQNFATKEDFNTLLEQLSKTTQATEKIRKTIEHEDWREREYRVIRRDKLEELMREIGNARHWLEQKKDELLFFGNRSDSQDPFDSVRVISRLYFSDLMNSINLLSSVYSDYLHYLFESRSKILSLTTHVDAKTGELTSASFNPSQLELLRERSQELSNFYGKLLDAINNLDADAAALMESIIKY